MPVPRHPAVTTSQPAANGPSEPERIRHTTGPVTDADFGRTASNGACDGVTAGAVGAVPLAGLGTFEPDPDDPADVEGIEAARRERAGLLGARSRDPGACGDCGALTPAAGELDGCDVCTFDVWLDDAARGAGR